MRKFVPDIQGGAGDGLQGRSDDLARRFQSEDNDRI